MAAKILQTGYKAKIKKDQMLKVKIAEALGVKISTVERWVKEDDLMLTTDTALSIIREHLALPAETEFTELKESESVQQ